MFKRFVQVGKVAVIFLGLACAIEMPSKAYCDHSHDIAPVVLEIMLDNPRFTIAALAALAITYGIAKTIKKIENKKNFEKGDAAIWVILR